MFCIAWLVYVHKLYSSSSAVARSSSESGAASAEAACVRQWLSRRERVEAVSLPSRASFLSISVSKGFMRLLDARACPFLQAGDRKNNRTHRAGPIFGSPAVARAWA